MPAAVRNDFLERLDPALDWRPLERALLAMYPAMTGWPPCAPLVLFKLSLLHYCYGLSDPQCEELVGDRLSWRRFVGLGLQDPVPDETTLVRFRQRLREHGLHEQLLGLVNRQLPAEALILKTCTLVDAALRHDALDPAAGWGTTLPARRSGRLPCRWPLPSSGRRRCRPAGARRASWWSASGRRGCWREPAGPAGPGHTGGTGWFSCPTRRGKPAAPGRGRPAAAARPAGTAGCLADPVHKPGACFL